MDNIICEHPEHVLSIILVKYMGEDYEIIRSLKQRHSGAQYVIVNKINLKSIILEHIFYDNDHLDNDTKLYVSLKQHNNTKPFNYNVIVLWEYHSRTLYYKRIERYIADVYPTVLLHNGECIGIPKAEISSGRLSLITEIKSALL